METAVASALETGYWCGRAFGRELVVRPLPSAVAFALVVFGVGGDAVVSAPDFVFGGPILAGSLALAYVGGGRL